MCSNELSFGGNSDQAARIPFQMYGAGIIPTNYTGSAPEQTLKNKKTQRRTIKQANKQMCDQLWCDKCVDRVHSEPR